MNNLTSLIFQSLMQANKGTTDDGYSTGAGLPTGAIKEGTMARKNADMLALKEMYRQALARGDFDKADQIMQMFNQMTGGGNAPQGNNQGY